jgi:hypothetical protein
MIGKDHMKRILTAALVFASMGAIAQTAPAAKPAQTAAPKTTQPAKPAAVSDQASLAEVNELLVLLKSRQQMESVLAGFKEQMKRGQMQGFELSLQKKGVTLTAAEKARAQKRLDAIADEMFQQMPYDEMMASTAEIYRRHFTSADVHALTAFYSSPSGQKFLAEMPALVQESMRSGGDIMSKHMPEIMGRVEKRIEELSDEFAKNPPASKP